jgi:hypothetical protein
MQRFKISFKCNFITFGDGLVLYYRERHEGGS